MYKGYFKKNAQFENYFPQKLTLEATDWVLVFVQGGGVVEQVEVCDPLCVKEVLFHL